MRPAINIVASFIAAVLITSVSASILSSQFVIAGLQNVGVDIDLATRASMTIKDLAIIKALAPVTAICFLVGFLIARTCIKYIGGSRHFWYTIAGGSALVCTLLLMSWQLQLAPVAGARTNLGLLTQGLAGSIGGFLFAKLSSRENV